MSNTSQSYLITKHKKYCNGCGVCSLVCNFNAIEMITDEKGFKYPKLDEKLCVNCGKCLKGCQYTNSSKENDTSNSKYYAAWNKNEASRLTASSGGVVEPIANKIIDAGGICVGAIYDKEFRVVHKVIQNKREIKLMKTSKYSQSDFTACLVETRGYLQEGRKVFFVGTPCQIEALYQFVGRKFSNLITCDLICGGVPSPKVFKEYLINIEKEYNSKIISINMKDKRNGWLEPTICIRFDNGVEFTKKLYDTGFGQFFLKQIITRESCHQCQYSSTNRVSDITVGDYWSVKKYHPDIYSTKGVSTVIVNSQKGRELLDTVTDVVAFVEVSEEESLQNRLSAGFKELNKEESLWFWKKYILCHDIEKVYLDYISIFSPKGSIQSSNYILQRLMKKLKNMLKSKGEKDYWGKKE